MSPRAGMQLSTPERAVLVAPDRVARAAASVVADHEQRWMLRQPREVRRSFAREVLDAGATDMAQERWMLLQPDAVRHSYVREVIDRRPPEQVALAHGRAGAPAWAIVAAGATATAAVAVAVWLLT